jgi:bacillithiol biosynthesis cysteine-adding enzyme BshC
VPAHQEDLQHAGGAANRSAVDVRRFPWIRKLAADYMFDFGRLASFFSGDPHDRSSWSASVRRARQQPRDRARLADVLAAQQRRRGAPDQSVRAAARLGDSSCVAIVTGQQAGLFGGPLFTLLKAITAIKLADQLARDERADVVPIFWVEAEDHDWDEVRACTVLDESLAARTIALPKDAAPDGTPVARVVLDARIDAAIEELGAALAPTEFREALLGDLRRAYAPGAGMADAFARWLERVLGHRGLVVFDASDPAAKPLASGVFARELSSPGETIARAAEAGRGLGAHGYHAQVHASDDGVALFRLDGARVPLKSRDGGFAAGDATFSAAALLEDAAERPQLFSPNVLLRPIVQDTIFPTVAYVAGPNELAYLGQLKGVYEHFGVPMPLMFPRASATLVDSGAARFLHKYNVPLETLQPQDEAALNDLLKAHIPREIEESFAEAGRAIEEHLARVSASVAMLDPTLEGAATSTLGRMRHDLGTLHNKTIQAAKRRDETLRRQFLRTRALVFPDGHPQERTIGFVSFLNQYGPALVDRLIDELPLDLGHHWIVTI